jgi:hypothetical protein
MILTSVLPYGRVAFGPDAAAVGFVEGAVITIVVLSTGSVLLRLDDEPAVRDPSLATLDDDEHQSHAHLDDEPIDNADTLETP